MPRLKGINMEYGNKLRVQYGRIYKTLDGHILKCIGETTEHLDCGADEEEREFCEDCEEINYMKMVVIHCPCDGITLKSNNMRTLRHQEGRTYRVCIDGFIDGDEGTNIPFLNVVKEITP